MITNITVEQQISSDHLPVLIKIKIQTDTIQEEIKKASQFTETSKIMRETNDHIDMLIKERNRARRSFKRQCTQEAKNQLDSLNRK
ncbi:hypothetical protein PR048_020116 [Dryococelus australis]|uniref:Endonuclease/exonuclease/phosphatase domain-containing protein n=1 Tax=Dryococelus australis TaxID=614101 RepID=A0ABQ9H5E7_9NEOP|nr:hypothetical protein PR048_020116 [Dryococelus australis]